MATKYEPLALHLWAMSREIGEVTLSFADIERILGARLPESAMVHRAWWGNQKDSKSRAHAHAWLSAGFVVDAVSQDRRNGFVRFKRQDGFRETNTTRASKDAYTSQPVSLPANPTKGLARSDDRETETQGYRSERSAAIYLVSCVSSKLATPAPAKDLYVSDWFRKARAYVESSGMPWFILSAQHGLLDPNARTAPYEKTLNAMSAHERKAWAQNVIKQMESRLPRGERAIVLAGERYRQHLLDYLHGRFPVVEVPLRGLRIGEQLQWFSERLRNGAA